MFYYYILNGNNGFRKFSLPARNPAPNAGFYSGSAGTRPVIPVRNPSTYTLL